MIRNLALLATWMVFAGCTSQSPVDPTPAAAATPATGASGAAATSTATQASAPAAASAGPPPGWKAKQRDGLTYYCRTVEITGSMFPKEKCYEPEVLEAMLQAHKEEAQRLDRPKVAPGVEQ